MKEMEVGGLDPFYQPFERLGDVQLDSIEPGKSGEAKERTASVSQCSLQRQSLESGLCPCEVL